LIGGTKYEAFLEQG